VATAYKRNQTGDPWDGPTPFEALCAGAAYINPVFKEIPNMQAYSQGRMDAMTPLLGDSGPEQERARGTSFFTRTSQHVFMERLGPPYVYHVPMHTGTGSSSQRLTRVIQEVLGRAPEAMEVPEFSRDAFDARLSALLSRNWCAAVGDVAQV
jgi:hypothetical protein